MIQWQDVGTVLLARPHGESSVILEVFTQDHGRAAGLIKGARGKKHRADLQAGTMVTVEWSARLDAHLGRFQIEPIRSRAPAIMSSKLALDGASTISGLLSRCLPEREAHTQLYSRTETLFDLLGQDAVFPLAYLQWELRLLNELGFSLDLDRCAVTGTTQDLCYVSPRTGRAVNRVAAGEWADRLLPLPPILKGDGDGSNDEIAIALQTTGYFLETFVLPHQVKKTLPQARERMVSNLQSV